MEPPDLMHTFYLDDMEARPVAFGEGESLQAAVHVSLRGRWRDGPKGVVDAIPLFMVPEAAREMAAVLERMADKAEKDLKGYRTEDEV